MEEEKKADSSFKTDEEAHSHHSSIHEDAQEAPKFVPMSVEGSSAGPLILRRKTTLTRSQIA